MSDTDDTDDLLLIPPDFFAIYSDTEDSPEAYGPYYKVVDHLITQVIELESRVNHIETSDTSLKSDSLDLPFNSPERTRGLMSKIRKYSSLENISKQDGYPSTQSTPQKPRTKFKINSLPSTPSSSERYISRRHGAYSHYGQGDRITTSQLPHDSRYSSAHPSQSNQNDGMLNEIDNFIANVKTIKRYDVARNLNKQFDKSALPAEDGLKTTGLNLNDIDEMLHDMDFQQMKIESRLREKEQQLGVNRNVKEVRENYRQRKLWKEGETKSSVPDRGMGMRDILYNKGPISGLSKNETTAPTQEAIMKESTPVGGCNSSVSNISLPNSESSSGGSQSLSSSDSTQLTAFNNQNSQSNNKHMNISPEVGNIHSKALEVLHMHENLLSRSTDSPAYTENNRKEINPPPETNLYISKKEFLKDKFSLKPDSKNSLVLLHLSELWNQNKSGDGAIKNDHSLNKLQEERLRRQHCEQLIQKLQTRILELQERLAVAIQVDNAKDEAILQIHKSWEESVDKVNDLSNQVVKLQQQISDCNRKTSHELSEAAKKISYYENESSKALNLAHGNQERLGELEKLNTHLTASLQSCKGELTNSESNYNSELNRNQQLSKILGQKELELNECKSILSDARKEVQQSKKAVEICQTELTSMKSSQSQLEQKIHEQLQYIRELENDKRKHAGDLEMHIKVEKTLRDDLKKQREMNEKNKMDLKNIYQDQLEIVVRDKLKEFQAQLEKAEGSLKDEVRKRELQVAKAAAIHIQQITEKHSLEVHLLEEKQKEEIKLQKLQLSQAQQQIESLNMRLQHQQQKKANIAQQLHRIMEAQWLEAIKIINNGKSPVLTQDKGLNAMDKLNYLKSRSHNNLEEILFKEDPSEESSWCDKTTQSNYQVSSETPVSTNPLKNKQQRENELQKYVQMLLDKSPGNPVEDQSVKEKYKTFPLDNQNENFSSNICGQQMGQDDNMTAEGTKSNKTNSRGSNKPPWK